MNNDCEILELAAKAVGIEVDFCRPELGGCLIRNGAVPCWWNPLTDDGDALRLAVQLGMAVHLDGFNEDVVRVDYGSTQVPPPLPLYETSLGDKCAATRRAIVRAAAEIGRNMK